MNVIRINAEGGSYLVVTSVASREQTMADHSNCHKMMDREQEVM
jgi:hypothetical protein